MYKIIVSSILVIVFIFSPHNGLNVIAVKKNPVTISMRNNALNATVKFLSAQKNCKAEDMIQHSINIQKNIENLSEFYHSTCKAYPLQKAEVTDLVVVSSELALVSTKLDYAERVVVQTSPVIKVDGKWKLVKGFNQGLVSAPTREIKPEILKVIDGYFNSMRSGDKKGLEKYGKDLSIDNQHNESLINDKRMNTLEYKANRMTMVSETVAIATIETTIDRQSKEKKYVIYKENDMWKVISNRHLVTTAIPKNANPVEVK